MSLFNELKRRNVFRVGTAYLVSAWLVVQVVETLFPVYDLPEAAVRWVVNLLGIGLLPTLVLAWVFEWTPEGLKKEKDTDHAAPTSLQAAKRLDRLILAMLALALGYFAFDKFMLDPVRDSQQLEVAVEQARETGRKEASEFVRDASIAVLAFEDLSPDASQAYFGEGLAVDLINQLGKVQELRVTGKTSAFSFQDSNATIPEIGKALNVGHVLDGSVSKSGNRIRISVELVDTREDKQLWSQSYDRTLDDIFAIRDEITFRIFDRLTIEFERLKTESLKTSPEVYDLTMQARHQFDHARSENSDKQAADLLEQALAIDPDYIPALLLSWRVTYDMLSVGHISEADARSLMHERTRRVLELDPGNGHALASLAWEGWEGRLDLELASSRFSAALKTAPGDLGLAWQAGIFARSIGRHEDSILLLERCQAADPLDANCRFQLAQSYLWGNRLEEALRAHREWQTLTGDLGNTYYLVLSLVLLDRAELALANFESFWANGENPQVLAAYTMVMHELGRQEDSSEALEQLERQFKGDLREEAYLLAQAYAWTGQTELAFEWLEKGYARDSRYGIKGYWFHRLMFLPIWQKLHNDPRWDEFRARMNMSQERLDLIGFSIPDWLSPGDR